MRTLPVAEAQPPSSPAVSRVTERRWIAIALALAIVLCSFMALTRLGERSPFYRFVLPQYSLGYFWGTPNGWTGYLDGMPVNRDSTQFESLAAFLRDESWIQVGLDGNVYTRFSGYALLGTVPAAALGRYGGFVLVNVLFWIVGALATYALARRHGHSPLEAIVAVALVATAPTFAALVGQGLPYVTSYALFAVGVWVTERVGLFARGVSLRTVVLAAAACGAVFLVYDVYMLPAFVVLYGLFRRVPIGHLALFLVVTLLPRVLWTSYWQWAGLESYSQNAEHPIRSLTAWFDPARWTSVVAGLKWYASLAAHMALNILAAFFFVPVFLAAYELVRQVRQPGWDWYVAVLLAGFAPGAFMVSTWPHIPRWYEYGYVAVYILAAAALVRLARALAGPAAPARVAAYSALLALPLILLANLDLVNVTRPMELLLFQPERWSYLWQW